MVSLLKSKVNLSSFNTRVKAGNTLGGLYNQITLSPLNKRHFWGCCLCPPPSFMTSQQAPGGLTLKNR